MRDNALYFPYIKVPQNSWFTHVLLYWDKVGSIVPTEYFESPERLGKYMQELVVAEMVTQVHPGAYIYRLRHFADNFLRFIDIQMRNKNHLRHALNNASPLVHIEKLGGVGRELEERHLAIHTSDYAWFRVVDWVANAFMTYLASCLGQLEDVNSAPVTEDVKTYTLLNYNHIFSPRASKVHNLHSETRTTILDRLLPVPDDVIRIAELVDFKSKHAGLLKSFRNKIEEECIAIANVRGKIRREQKLELAINRLENDIKTIEDIMKSKWKQIVYKSFFPLFASGASLGTANFSKPVAWGGAVTSAVNSGHKSIHAAN